MTTRNNEFFIRTEFTGHLLNSFDLFASALYRRIKQNLHSNLKRYCLIDMAHHERSYSFEILEIIFNDRARHIQFCFLFYFPFSDFQISIFHRMLLASGRFAILLYMICISDLKMLCTQFGSSVSDLKHWNVSAQARHTNIIQQCTKYVWILFLLGQAIQKTK